MCFQIISIVRRCHNFSIYFNSKSQSRTDIMINQLNCGNNSALTVFYMLKNKEQLLIVFN